MKSVQDYKDEWGLQSADKIWFFPGRQEIKIAQCLQNFGWNSCCYFSLNLLSSSLVFYPFSVLKTQFFPSRENTLANKQEKFFCWSGVRGVFVTDRPTFVRVFCIKKVKTKSRADGKKNCLRLKEPEQYTKIIKRQQRHHWTIVLIKISWERKTKLWASATTLVIGINNVQVLEKYWQNLATNFARHDVRTWNLNFS